MHIYAGTLQKTAVVQILDLILWILRWMDLIDLMGYELHGLVPRQVQRFRLRFTGRPGGNSAFLKFLILKSLCKERLVEATEISAAVSKDWRNTVSMKHVPIAISQITDLVDKFTVDYLPSRKKSDLPDAVDAFKNMLIVSPHSVTLLADFGSFPGNLPQQWHKSDQLMPFCWAKS